MKAEMRALAHDLAKDSIVTDALAQFIAQVIEELHKTKIAKPPRPAPSPQRRGWGSYLTTTLAGFLASSATQPDRPLGRTTASTNGLTA